MESGQLGKNNIRGKVMLKRLYQRIRCGLNKLGVLERNGSSRIFHGDLLSPSPDTEFRTEDAFVAENGEPLAPDSTGWGFKHFFPELAENESKLLPIEDATVTCLRKLGQPDSMNERFRRLEDPPLGVSVPTIYTFFGQFVDHDITHQKDTLGTASPIDRLPLSMAEIEKMNNLRSPNLDLDSVYGSEPDENFPPRELGNLNRLRLAKVEGPASLPRDRCNDDFQDLYRGEPGVQPRKAVIGDPRNDENLILAQLHVAFLRAHNQLIDFGNTFQQARELLTQHYQWIVLNEFLPKIVDPTIVDRVRQGNRLFMATKAEELYMPLEFSVAAFRFGHSKIRGSYVFNDNLAHLTPSHEEGSPLEQLFTFTHFAGNLAGRDQLLRLWVIDWKNFLYADEEKHRSRPIDTSLTGSLLKLTRDSGMSLLRPQDELKRNLAVRNLLRGYHLRIPTGQAVAEAVNQKMPDISPLDNDKIVAALTPRQQEILTEAQLLKHMPLWFYILAEAKADNGGNHLGPVGGAIVAETIIGILRLSKYSILAPLQAGWKPTLPSSTPGQFHLKDLLILAGVYKEPGFGC
jgi:hypothetical protein